LIQSIAFAILASGAAAYIGQLSVKPENIGFPLLIRNTLAISRAWAVQIGGRLIGFE
jgi:hypothetical protein